MQMEAVVGADNEEVVFDDEVEQQLKYLCGKFILLEWWDDLETVLTNFQYLELKVEKGMVAELADDFAAAAKQVPADRPYQQVFGLVEQALRRELHFINKHPTTLFQCLWNACWWPANPGHTPHFGSGSRPTLGEHLTDTEFPASPLLTLLESWRSSKLVEPSFAWVRTLRPLPGHTFSGLAAVSSSFSTSITCVAASPDGNSVAIAEHSPLYQYRPGENRSTKRIP